MRESEALNRLETSNLVGALNGEGKTESVNINNTIKVYSNSSESSAESTLAGRIDLLDIGDSSKYSLMNIHAINHGLAMNIL